jgi:hypothetical protein
MLYKTESGLGIIFKLHNNNNNNNNNKPKTRNLKDKKAAFGSFAWNNRKTYPIPED